MLSSASDESGDERGWNICDKNTGEAMAREECKVLNCSSQKATANPPRRNLNAAAFFA